MVRSRIGDGWTILFALLVMCLLVIVLLARQAYDADRSHQAAAERALKDYAGLAADELVRRVGSRLGFGAYTVLQRFERLAKSDPLNTELPSREALAAGADARVAPAFALPAGLFRYRPSSDSLELTHELDEPGLRPWLIAAIQASRRDRNPEDPSYMASFFRPVGDAEMRFVILRPAEGEDDAPTLGLALDRTAVRSALEEALRHDPLLPATLGDGQVGNESLAVHVVDAAGGPLWSAELGTSDSLYRTRTEAQRGFDDVYGGLFDGWQVRLSLDPAVASQLVIGGLPRTRLPTLGGLLALAVVLVATAVWQLRRARRLSRLRTDFVAQASHELRTPLTQIRMFTETLLLERVRSPQEARRALEIVDQEARRLGHLVENILQFARRERGAIRLMPTRQPVAPLLRAVIDDFQPLAKSRDTQITACLDDEVQARVDADALRQIVLNLLDNAVKYGPIGQEVHVRLDAAPPWARLRIDDQGPGIPRRQREVIWRSYRRLERDRTTAVAGTGIGLAVVLELVDLHAGRARVDGGARGGACFTVELPLSGNGHGARP